MLHPAHTIPFAGSLLMLYVATPAHASSPGEAIHPAAPWALATDDPHEATRGLDHEARPGVLYIAMNGVTLEPTCPGGSLGHAALNCSALVDEVTQFPAYGTGQQQAAIIAKLNEYFDAFNLIITTTRPPDYLPYAMVAVGHTPSSCGFSWITCDGVKRNHVSISGTCGSITSDIAASAAKTWGLDATEESSDMMYWLSGPGKSFLDECVELSHVDGPPMCTFVHEIYCPDGATQNSFQELLGVFGPRKPDAEAPRILQISPADGAVFSTSDSFEVTADVGDDFNTLGVKWSWIEGVPADVGDSYTKCTNGVCDLDFDDWKPIDTPWEFLILNKPPAGVYGFKLEVMDAYGHLTTQTVHVTVSEGGETADTDAGTESDSGTAGGTGGTNDGDSSDGTTVSGNSASGGGVGEAGGGGCECQVTPGRTPALMGLVLLAGCRRRRRR